MKTIVSLIILLLFSFCASAAVLRPANPADLFFADETPDGIILICDDATARPKDISYAISDYCGNTIAHGCLIQLDNNQYLFKNTIKDIGFYEICLPGFDHQRLGFQILPPMSLSPDAFFGIDTCFSVFPIFNDLDLASRFMAILSKSGIISQRDRLNWPKIHSSPVAEVNPDVAPYHFLSKRKIASEYGIKTLDVFHLPLWWEPRRNNSIYPDDMLLTAASWQKIAGEMSPYWDKFEVWNEPDAVTFGQNLPGCVNGTLLRTLSYEFRHDAPNISIISGVFCPAIFPNDVNKGKTPDPQDVAYTQHAIEQYLENGLLDSADALSFHNYDHPGSISRNMHLLRQVFAPHPRAALPLLVTECGQRWNGHAGIRATLQDDLLCGRVIAGKAIETKATGGQGFYAFVLNYYTEDNVGGSLDNYGMVDGAYSPMRSYNAYIVAARKLAHARYIGDLPDIPDADFAWCFTTDTQDKIICVIYDDDASGIHLPSQYATAGQLFGADGRIIKIEPTADGCQLTDKDGIFYLELPANALALTTNTPQMDLLKIAESWKSAPREAKPVVIQYMPQEGDIWTYDGFTYPDQESATVEIRFNNLSDRQLTINPKCQFPDGITPDNDLPSELTISAQSQHTVLLKAKVNRQIFDHCPASNIIISDLSNQAAPLNIRINKTQWRQTITANPEYNPNIATILSNKINGRSSSDRLHPIIEGVRLDSQSDWECKYSNYIPQTEAILAMNYDREHLQIIAQVYDENGFHQPYSNNQMWAGDSIQIALQTDGGKYISDACASLCHGQPAIYTYYSDHGKHIPVNCQLQNSTLDFIPVNDKEYIYVVNLDLAELGIQPLDIPRNLSIAVIINNSDGHTRHGYLKFGDGIGGPKNPGQYNRLILKK